MLVETGKVFTVECFVFKFKRDTKKKQQNQLLKF